MPVLFFRLGCQKKVPFRRRGHMDFMCVYLVERLTTGGVEPKNDLRVGRKFRLVLAPCHDLEPLKRRKMAMDVN